MHNDASFALSVRGRRETNQDACLILEKEQIKFLAVADGMGGAAGGETASQQVVEACRHVFDELSANELDSPGGLKDALKTMFFHARKRLQQIIAKQPELSGMGTTLSCVLLSGNSYVWGNIGDSRVYLFDGASLRQLTTDHSFVEEYRQQHGPDIPAYVRQQSNIITRALGGDNDSPDIFPEDKDYESIENGHGFVICSDGLLPEKVDDDASWIADYLVQTNNLKEAAESMVSHAFAGGSTDNISVVLYEYGTFRRNVDRKDTPPILRANEKLKSKHYPCRKTKVFLLTIALFAIILFAGIWLFQGKLLCHFQRKDPALMELDSSNIITVNDELPKWDGDSVKHERIVAGNDFLQSVHKKFDGPESQTRVIVNPDWEPWAKTEIIPYGPDENLVWEKHPAHNLTARYRLFFIAQQENIGDTLFKEIENAHSIMINQLALSISGLYTVSIIAEIAPGSWERPEKDIELKFMRNH